jgi:hypothetical protein
MTESSRQTDGGLSSYQRSQLRFPLEDEETSSSYDITSSDRDSRRGLDHHHHHHQYQQYQHQQRHPDLSGARRTYYVLLGILMASALYAFLASPPPPFPPAPWAASSSSLSSATISEDVKVEAAAIPTTVQDVPAASTSASLLMVASKLWGRPRFDDETDEGRHGKLKPKVGATSSSSVASSPSSSEAQAVAGLQLQGYPSVADQLAYEREMGKLDWDAIEADLERVMTDSQEFWPADYGHYGGLFVRLSWHSCGSYRLSDGRGGCDGGGQRYGTITDVGGALCRAWCPLANFTREHS